VFYAISSVESMDSTMGTPYMCLVEHNNHQRTIVSQGIEKEADTASLALTENQGKN